MVKKNYLRFKRKLSWFRIRYFSEEKIRKIAMSIDFIKRNGEWKEEEKKYFKTIESIRKTYENSQQKIFVQDFGAGSVNSLRTSEEMEKGIASSKRVSEIYKKTSSPDKWGKLIFKLIRDLKPQQVLELGTSLGISAAYQISALKINGDGKFTSIEGAGEVAKFAKVNLELLNYPDVQIENGKFIDVLTKILHKEIPIDLVFIDGHHDKTATKEYFELIYPFLAKNAVLVFDDIDWSVGMREVWKEIFEDPRIKVSFDLKKWGICLVNDNTSTRNKNHLKLAF